MRRILLLAVGLVAAMAVVVVAATSSGLLAPVTPPPPPAPPVAAVTYLPPLDSTDVSPASTTTVDVQHGRLDEVTLTDANGNAVPGEFNAERTSWSSTKPLDYSGNYSWAGRATGTDGQAVPLTGTFSTVAPKKIVRGTPNIDDDRTVGVAARSESSSTTTSLTAPQSNGR